MRFLSRADVHSLGIDLDTLVAALQQALLASAAGEIAGRPKSGIGQADGAFFIGTLGAWQKRNLGIFHSIAGAPPATLAPGEPNYRTWQLVTDYGRGTAICVVDGSFTSSMLPAGITALGARAFARPDSHIATFIGAGEQSRVNLDALTKHFRLTEVRVVGRSQANAEAFAKEVRARGLKALVATSPQQAVAGADVIVSTVPSSPGFVPFLDPDWVSPGAFVSGVDLCRSWKDGFEKFDRIISDDRTQATAQHAEGRLHYGGAYDTELTELVTGKRPGRQHAKDRIVMIHPGTIVGVLGITALIVERAGLI